MQLSNFHPMIVGEWVISQAIVCNDGTIRTVSVEQYIEGIVAVRTELTGSKISNNKCYKTARKAINAAAKW